MTAIYPFAIALLCFIIQSNNVEGAGEGDNLTVVNDGFGVDVSFPVHSQLAPESWRHDFYKKWLEGCRNLYSNKSKLRRGLDTGSACDETEKDRLLQNLSQPAEMVNFTETGYHKLRAPDEMFGMIRTFWEANKDDHKVEEWGEGDTTVNHWDSQATFVDIKEEDRVGGGPEIEDHITSFAEKVISEWVGRPLRYTSLYGVRTYFTGAVLSPHVDRNPLICSAIINVDQDVDEPWPLEIYGRDGKAVNITMEPGDMVLYESHSLIHGRPYPLKGRHFANIFIHFEPVLTYEEGVDPSDQLPFYILPNTTSERAWRKYNAGELVDIHDAARKGKLSKIELALSYWEDEEMLSWETDDGWQIIHEAAAEGQTEIIKYLLGHNIDVNVLTTDGASPLYIAESELDASHATIAFLKENGAESIETEEDEF